MLVRRPRRLRGTGGSGDENDSSPSSLVHSKSVVQLMKKSISYLEYYDLRRPRGGGGRGLVGTMRYFWAKVYFKSEIAPGRS